MQRPYRRPGDRRRTVGDLRWPRPSRCRGQQHSAFAAFPRHSSALRIEERAGIAPLGGTFADRREWRSHRIGGEGEADSSSAGSAVGLQHSPTAALGPGCSEARSSTLALAAVAFQWQSMAKALDADGPFRINGARGHYPRSAWLRRFRLNHAMGPEGFEPPTLSFEGSCSIH
jgi:hypothetical protein